VDIRINPKVPPVFHQLEKVYPELPAEPTQIQQFFNNLASLDLHSLQTNLNGLITRLDTTVGELRMTDINAGVTNLLVSINRLVTDPEITNGLAGIRPTLDQYRELGAKVPVGLTCRRQCGPLLRRPIVHWPNRGAGENSSTMLAPDSPVRND
jgi:hypothetical protein